MSDNDHPPIAVYPPYAGLTAIILSFALSWLVPLAVLPPFGSTVTAVIGVILMLIAGWLAISAMRAFKGAGTNVDPHEPALTIVRNGPYRFTRNPMYLGMVTLVLGLGLTFSLDWAVLIVPILWLTLHFGVVLREEAYLTAKFGDEYSALLEQTRRWL